MEPPVPSDRDRRRMRMTPQTQQLEQLDPAEVRARIRGRVTAPGDPSYDADRTVVLGGVGPQAGADRPGGRRRRRADGHRARPEHRPRPRGAIGRPQRRGPRHRRRRDRPRRPRPRRPPDRRNGADGVGRQRPDRRRVHERRGGAWPRDGLRRYRIGRHRRDHARWRRRLPRAQVRADDRQPAGGRDRHGRRRGPRGGRGSRARPVLGDPRRRRQLRRGDALPVPARTRCPRWSAGC